MMCWADSWTMKKTYLANCRRRQTCTWVKYRDCRRKEMSSHPRSFWWSRSTLTWLGSKSNLVSHLTRIRGLLLSSSTSWHMSPIQGKSSWQMPFWRRTGCSPNWRSEIPNMRETSRKLVKLRSKESSSHKIWWVRRSCTWRVFCLSVRIYKWSWKMPLRRLTH